MNVASKRHHSWTLLFLFLLRLLPVASVTDATLKHVQVIFRHGERVPTTFRIFPNESPRMLENFPYEPGEMTNNGLWQEYSLGANLRLEYAQELLGDHYTPSKLRVLSGIDNRTLESAQLVLASMVPVGAEQRWNPQLAWLPIPVVGALAIDTVSFGAWDRCPAVTEELVSGRKYAQIFADHQPMVQQLETLTGMAIPNLNIFQKVLDGIKSRSHLNSLLPLPAWAANTFFLTNVTRVQNDIHGRYIDLFIDALGGWHLDVFASAMEDYFGNRTNHRMVLYSAVSGEHIIGLIPEGPTPSRIQHDTNMMTIGRYLGIAELADRLPDYGSYLSFELHQYERPENGSSHVVKAYFHPVINGTKQQVALGKCPTPCSVAAFAAIGQRWTTEEWTDKCLGRTSQLVCSIYATVAGVLLILLVLLIAALVLVIWGCCSYKAKYQRLADPEQVSLLRS